MRSLHLLLITLFCIGIAIPGTTKADPVLILDEDAIEIQLQSDEVAEREINLTNAGDENLLFNIEIEMVGRPERDRPVRSVRSVDQKQSIGPHRDDFGDVIDSYDLGNSTWSGLAWDGELMWGIEHNSGGMAAFDRDAEDLDFVGNLNRRIYGLAYDGECFWMGFLSPNGAEENLMRVDRDGNIVRTLFVDAFVIGGVAFDGENLWYHSADPWRQNMNVHKITLEGDVLQTINLIDIMPWCTMSIEWVNDHPDGKFWTAEWSRGMLRQIDLEDGELRVVQQCRIQQSGSYGLAHDGTNLWCATYEGTWYVIDDGIQEMHWLSCEPAEGEIEPDNDLDIVITFNAADLVEGDYEADLHFYSNDPDNGETVVNVLMSVGGIPEIEVTWDEEIGYPDEINWNLANENVFTGYESIVPVILHNVGTGDLVVEEIVFDNDDFSTDAEDIALATDELIESNLVLFAEENGIHEGVMTIVWNSPDGEEFTVDLIGETSGAPVFIVDPNEISVDLNTGEVFEENLVISNEGASTLTFEVESELVNQPDRDHDVNSIRSISHHQRPGPARDDYGDVTRELEVGRGTWSGLAWDGELMWGIQRDSDRFFGVDTSSGEIVREIEYHVDGTLQGLEWDGQSFWAGIEIIERRGKILRFDLEGNVIRTLEVDGITVFGITWDGDNLWYFSVDRMRQVRFAQITPEGELIREVDCSGLLQGLEYSIKYISEHPDGNLLTINWLSNTLYQIDIDGDQPQITNQIQLIDSHEFGIEHDGYDIWYSTSDGFWYTLDDGIEDVRWLSVLPKEGEVDPEENMEITVRINAERLGEGEYEADLHFLTNDPESPDENVVVLLIVTGAPVLDIVWDEDFGYPEHIDWNQGFEDVFVGGPYSVPVRFINAGREELVVESITCEDQAFTADPDNLNLEQNSETVVEFIFSGEDTRPYQSEMVINWNAVDDQDINIEMVAHPTESPIIVVEPDVIEHDLNLGQTTEDIINIANDGEGLLRYKSDFELIAEPEVDFRGRSVRSIEKSTGAGPRRDNLGDVLKEYEVFDDIWTGLEYDGELMWGISHMDRQLVSYDPRTERVVETYDVPTFYFDLAYDGEGFWTGPVTNGVVGWLHKLDREGNVIRSFEVDGIMVYGVTFDGENIWYYSACPMHDIILRQITVEGELLREVDCTGLIVFPRISLCWVPSHLGGEMWATSWEDGTLYQLDLSGDEPEIIQSIDMVPPRTTFGIAHDGHNLWYCETSPTWRVIDDGISTVSWLTLDPDQGELEPESDVDALLSIDTIELTEGEYEVALHILNNDPRNPDLVVNIVVNVIGAPILDTRWSEEAGYPDFVDWNSAFVDLYTGTEYSIPVMIRNTGLADLNIEEISCVNESFSVDVDNFALAPDERRIVNFSLEAEEDGVHQSAMTIVWNSPDDQPYEIPLRAETIAPPQIMIEPGVLQDELMLGQIARHNLSVRNTGDTMLRFTIRREVVDEPNLEIPQRDDPGDIIRQYQMEQAAWTGLAWDGQMMWAFHAGRMQLFVVNPESGEIVDRIDLEFEENGFGLTWDGENFWGGIAIPEGNDVGRMRCFNRNGGILRVMEVEGLLVYGVTWDGENLWYYSLSEDQDSRVFRQMTTEGELLREVDVSNLIAGQMLSLTWVPDHNDCELWVLDWANTILYQLDVNGDQPVVIQQVEVVRSQFYALEHDGENLRHTTVEGDWYVIDDGIDEVGWFTVNPETGQLEPDSELEVTVTFKTANLIEGLYEGELIFQSNDPDEGEIIINITLSVVDGFLHFIDFVETELQHNLIVTSLTIDNEPAPANCEIGVFTPGNVLSGAAIWNEGNQPVEFSAYGAVEEREQFVEGEVLNFQVWDSEADIEYDAVADFQEGLNTFVANGESTFSLSVQSSRELLVRMRLGWNLISLNVIPPEELWEREQGPDVILMLDQLRDDEGNHHVLLFKSESGHFYIPAWDFNSIPYWNLTRGYLIKLDRQIDATWSGMAIAADAVIPLEPGWNTIAYYPDYVLDASAPDFYVLSPIIDNVSMAKDCSGNFLITDFNFSNMSPWRETQGYQVKIEADDPIIFNYPPEQEGGVFLGMAESSAETGNHWTKPVPTGENMSILIRSIYGYDPGKHDQIAALSASGRIVGVGNIHDGMCGFAVWGDDETTDRIDGLTDSETFKLFLWDQERDGAVELSISTILEGSDVVYEKDGLIVLDAVAKQAVPEECFLAQNYPNPFNSSTKLTYGLTERALVSIRLYDISGRLMQILFEGEKDAGFYTTSWDAADVSAGVYFVKMTANDFKTIRKLTLIR